MNQQRYLIFGNAESTHLLKWVGELVKYYQVFILSPLGVHDKIRELVPEENIYCLHMSIHPEGGNAKLLTKLFRFKSIIKKINPDIVNAHYVTSHGFISALIKRIFGAKYFLIESAWGTDILVTPNKSSLYKRITKYSLNAADLITSDSDFMSNAIGEFSKVSCITFPFGLNEMPDVKKEDKDPNLYFSNRALTENYNIGKIIELFSQIIQTNKAAKLVISNDGALRGELENLVNKLGIEQNVTFKGFLDAREQGEVYKKTTYFFSIPTSDSTSVSLLEAMAYGCIPILSDLPANREWVEHGENGLILREEIIADLPSIENVFDFNRNIISERAIFSKNMTELVDIINGKV